MSRPFVVALVLPMLAAVAGCSSSPPPPPPPLTEAVPPPKPQAPLVAELESPPPPPSPMEIVPPPPRGSDADTWQPGHWRRIGDASSGHWAWVSGHYVERPPGRTAWVVGQWRSGPGGWVWVEGHWE